MTGPERLRMGKALLEEVRLGRNRTAVQAVLIAEANAHFLAAQVIAFAAVHLPERVSWQQAGDA